jgi:hypothetical protein
LGRQGLPQLHPYKVLDRSSRPGEALAINSLSAVVDVVRSLRGRLRPEAHGPEVYHSTSGLTAPEDVQRTLNFCWLIHKRIAGCRGPNLPADLQALRSLHIGALVRLAATDGYVLHRLFELRNQTRHLRPSPLQGQGQRTGGPQSGIGPEADRIIAGQERKTTTESLMADTVS